MTQHNDSIDRLIGELAHFKTRSPARSQLLSLDPCPVDRLLAILVDGDTPLNQRWAAITVLAHAQAEAAVSVLLEVMRSESNLLDESATALRKITGLDCGQTVEEWEVALGIVPAPPPVSEAEESAPAVCSDLDNPQQTELGEELQAVNSQDLVALVKEALVGQANSVEWDAAGYVCSRVVVGDREQQVLVAPGETVGLERGQVMIYTECGVVPDTTEDALRQAVPPPPLGELDIADGQDGLSLNLRYLVPLVDLAPDPLGKAILAIARYSDGIEADLTGQDRI